MNSTKASAALVLSLASSALAGMTAVMQGHGRQSTIYVEGSRMRMEHGGEGGVVWLFDAEKKQLTILDPKAKTYSEANEADMKAAGARFKAQMDAARRQMESAMAKMPPAQRAQMEAMMAKRGQTSKTPPPEPTSFEPTGAKSTVAGFACDGYREVRGGQTRAEGCYIPWGPAVSREDLKPLRAMSEFMSDMIPPGMDAGRATIADQFGKAPGFPALRAAVDASGKKSDEERLVSLTRGAVPADKFAVPAGFKESERARLFGGGAR